MYNKLINLVLVDEKKCKIVVKVNALYLRVLRRNNYYCLIKHTYIISNSVFFFIWKSD